MRRVEDAVQGLERMLKGQSDLEFDDDVEFEISEGRVIIVRGGKV